MSRLADSLLRRIAAAENTAAFFCHTRELAIEVAILRTRLGIVEPDVPPPAGRAPWPVDPRCARLLGPPP